MADGDVGSVLYRWIVLRSGTGEMLRACFEVTAANNQMMLVGTQASDVVESAVGMTITARVALRDQATGDRSDHKARLTLPWHLVAYYFDVTAEVTPGKGMVPEVPGKIPMGFDLRSVALTTT